MAIRPPILKIGDTIGIVSLGSPMETSEINTRVDYLKNLGFEVILGEHVYESNGYLAGTAQQRASDLMRMYQNKKVKAILPTRGGVGVAGILPYLNYRVIAENPKIISGYSDISILLNTIYQFINQITFHSLMLKDFIDSTPQYSFNQFFSATSTLQAPRVINNPPDMQFMSRVEGNVTGPLVGGNLTSIVGSLGTPYELNTKGKILLLEDIREPVNTLYRYLLHLKIAGKLKDCIGIIMGECTECTDAYGKTYEDLITDFLVPLGKPLLTNLASGHGEYNAAVPIGAKINLNTIQNTITVLEPTVKNAI